MDENFRQFLDRLRQHGELVDLHQPIDIRHIARLSWISRTRRSFFHNVIGYKIPVVSGVIRTRERATMGMGCTDFSEIEKAFDRVDQADSAGNASTPRYLTRSSWKGTRSISTNCRSRCHRSTTAAP